MAKRRSGALKTAKFPPPSPFRSKPYSLGDVEYRAEMQKYLKDDPTAQLAMRRIEQLTGGDYGQVIKYILPRKDGVEKSSPEKRLEEIIKNILARRGEKLKGPASMTNLGGIYLPTEEQKGENYKGQVSQSGALPEIFVQRPDVFDQEYADDVEKESLKVGKDFKPGYFERLLEKLGIKDVDRSLKRRREKGTMPTEEDMKQAKETMPFEKTARHELDHFGLDLLRALGYKLPYVDNVRKEEQFVGMLDDILEAPGYKSEPSSYTKFSYDIKDQIDAMAKDALKKERGYKQGGLVAMLKSFK
tara:strand:+ start:151 stop:1056 length:906 start_codon:yes stop_codon:yes gene_type:complete